MIDWSVKDLLICNYGRNFPTKNFRLHQKSHPKKYKLNHTWKKSPHPMWLCSQTEAARLFQLVDLRCCDIPAAHLLLETPIQVILPQPASETWVENQKLWIHQVLSEAICVIYRKSEDVNRRHVKSLVSKSQVLQWIITIMNIIPLSKSQNRYDIYICIHRVPKHHQQNSSEKNTSPLFFPLFTKLIDSRCAPWHRESSQAKARSYDPHRGIDWTLSTRFLFRGFLQVQNIRKVWM